MDKFAKYVPTWLRSVLGLMMLNAAIDLLPSNEPARIGMMRGLAEQRKYERYSAYTSLMGKEPIPFSRWREIGSTFRLRASRHIVKEKWA